MTDTSRFIPISGQISRRRSKWQGEKLPPFDYAQDRLASLLVMIFSYVFLTSQEWQQRDYPKTTDFSLFIFGFQLKSNFLTFS